MNTTTDSKWVEINEREPNATECPIWVGKYIEGKWYQHFLWVPVQKDSVWTHWISAIPQNPPPETPRTYSTAVSEIAALVDQLNNTAMTKDEFAHAAAEWVKKH